MSNFQILITPESKLKKPPFSTLSNHETKKIFSTNILCKVLTTMHASKYTLPAKELPSSNAYIERLHFQVKEATEHSNSYKSRKEKYSQIFSSKYFSFYRKQLIGVRFVYTLSFLDPVCWNHMGYVVLLLQLQIIVDILPLSGNIKHNGLEYQFSILINLNREQIFWQMIAHGVMNTL